MGLLDTIKDWAGPIGDAVGGFFGDDDGKQEVTTTQVVQPSTTGTTEVSDFDFVFNQNAVNALYDLGVQMNRWAGNDRYFLENTYLPFQKQIIDSNTQMLPVIERTSTATLEEMSKDIVQNDLLKSVFRERAVSTDPGTQNMLSKLDDALGSIPSESERVSQALASVESQFSQAGKDLTRQYQSRGQQVSQASSRDLAFQKAKAKSGAADAASEAARTENLQGLTSGLTARNQANLTEAQIQATATNQLTSLQTAQQAGLDKSQISGVTAPTEQSQNVASGLIKAGAEQTFGTRSTSDTAVQVQKGVVNPALTSGATGGPPATNIKGIPQGGMPAVVDQPGAISAARKRTDPIQGLMHSLQQASAGLNPR